MSFGFSVGDFLAVGQLAWKVYTACQKAPDNFKSIAQEVQSLHAALKTADEALSALSFSTEQESNRDTILVGCHGVLHDLDELVKKYLDLEKKKKWSLSRIKFGSEDLTGIRARLTSNIGILNTFIIATLESQRVQNTIRQPRLRSVHTITDSHIYQYPELQVPHFIKRDEESEALDKEFKSASKNGKRPPVVILLGMGGAGKTQLALDYCRRAEEDGKYDSIFWVDARSPSTVARSFELLAEEMYGPEQKFLNSEATIASIKRTLRQCKNTWLMVFDNFDQPDQFPTPVSNYWPNTAMGTILFTSRHETSKLLGSSIEVSRMSDEEGIKLLANRIGRSPNDEDKIHLQIIVSILGNLALAIDQAGAYIIQHHLGLSLAEYPSIYQSRKKELLEEIPGSAMWYYSRKRSDDAPSESALSVFTTWQMSFDSIKGDSEQKRVKGMVLSLSAFLESTSISEKMFQKCVEAPQPIPDYMAHLAPGRTWDKFKFRSIISEFKTLSLIQSLSYEANGIHFSLHPLVRDWVQLRLSPNIQAILSVDAAVLVSLSLPGLSDPKGVNGEMEGQLLQLMDNCIKNCENYLDREEWLFWGPLTEVGYRYAVFYGYVGGSRLSDAEIILRRILAWRKKHNKAGDRRIIMILLRLASDCKSLGRLKECKDLTAEALELSEKLLSKEDPLAWLVQFHRGVVLIDEQRTAEAAILLEECYKNQLKTLGTENHKTLSTISTLSTVYKSEMKLDKAEEYARIALQGRIAVYGLDHLLTLSDQVLLSEILIKRGDIEGGQRILLETLELGQARFGPSSSRIVMINRPLAETYKLQKRFSEAIEILTRNKAILEKTYGKESSYLLGVLENLAQVYILWATSQRSGTGDSAYLKAQNFLLEAQSIIYKVRGPHQWANLHCVKRYLVYVHQGREEYEKAEALASELLADLQSRGSPISAKELLWMTYSLYKAQMKKVEMAHFLERALCATRELLGARNMYMLMYLKRAQEGYSLLNSAEGMDRWSFEVLRLWDEAGGPRYHELKVDEAVALLAAETPLPLGPDDECEGLLL